MVGSRSASGGGGSAVATRGGGTTSESGGVAGGCARATSGCAETTRRLCQSNERGQGHSERVQRSNEWVGRAMGGGSGGTASRGSEIVGREVGVAIGNGAGPSKGRGPKGRLANVLGIAARKNETLQRTGVIMERFEDQRNPGAAGKRAVESGAVEPNFQPKPYRTELFYARYRSRNAPQCNGKYSIIERIQRQICDEGAPTHSDNDDATPYEPVASFAHLLVAGGVQGGEYRHPTRCARINAPDDAAVGGVLYVPTEILCEIFSWTLPHEWVRTVISKAVPTAPWRLTHVCRKWRDAARGCANLWSCIRIDSWAANRNTTFSTCYPLAALETQLELSSGVPLDVGFFTRCPNLELPEIPLFEALVLHSNRWERLKIYPGTFCALSGIKGQLALLHRLEIPSGFSEWPDKIAGVFAVAPRLREVVLSDENFDNYSPDISLPCVTRTSSGSNSGEAEGFGGPFGMRLVNEVE
ncbi:hypothetical protein B0H14DRAFT_2570584 [Mycena olivaceomarginata]|nr:hypothetical protein B0H14DRAFT_2570584 [Mycena olivaceomarginata]